MKFSRQTTGYGHRYILDIDDAHIRRLDPNLQVCFKQNYECPGEISQKLFALMEVAHAIENMDQEKESEVFLRLWELDIIRKQGRCLNCDHLDLFHGLNGCCLELCECVDFEK